MALEGLGISVDELAPASMHPEGTLQFDATDEDGPLSVKVYGRDAWDGQLLANAWRLAWYRDTQRTVRLSRLELVEHEGFVTLLADRAGVRVPRLITAGSAGQGDALVVVRPDGVPLPAWTGTARRRGASTRCGTTSAASTTPASPTAESTSTDSSPARRHDRLRRSLVGHGRRRTVRHAAGPGPGPVRVAAARRRGPAAAAARRALGDDGLLPVLPYVQEAAMAGGRAPRLADQDVELDDVRGRLRALLGAPEQSLIRLRRVTWGSVFNLALLAIAAYALIAVFSDIDMASFLDELRDASWAWLVFALLLAQLPRLPSAVSTMGSVQQPLPLGPLFALQFAICYVNLAIPSTAARWRSTCASSNAAASARRRRSLPA